MLHLILFHTKTHSLIKSVPVQCHKKELYQKGQGWGGNVYLYSIDSR